MIKNYISVSGNIYFYGITLFPCIYLSFIRVNFDDNIK